MAQFILLAEMMFKLRMIDIYDNSAVQLILTAAETSAHDDDCEDDDGDEHIITFKMLNLLNKFAVITVE